MAAQRENKANGAKPPDRVDGRNTPLQSLLHNVPRTTLFLWLAAISMGLFFLPLYLIASTANSDVNRMEVNLTSIKGSLTNVPTPLPEVQKVLTPLAQVQAQIAQVKTLYPATVSSKADWPTVMEAIGRYDPGQITLISLNRTGNRITLAGKANDEASVSAYVSTLEQSNLFSLVTVQSLQLIDTSSLTMTLMASKTVTVTTTATSTPTPTKDPRDQYEPDDSQPKLIFVGQSQQHSFYPNGDVDTVTFLAKAFGYYRVSTKNLATGVDTVLTVRVGRSTFVNNQATPGTPGSVVVFQNNGPDTMVSISLTNKGAFGPDKTYTLLVEELGPPPTNTALPTPTSAPSATMVPTPTQTPFIINVTATPIASSFGPLDLPGQVTGYVNVRVDLISRDQDQYLPHLAESYWARHVQPPRTTGSRLDGRQIRTDP